MVHILRNGNPRVLIFHKFLFLLTSMYEHDILNVFIRENEALIVLAFEYVLFATARPQCD